MRPIIKTYDLKGLTGDYPEEVIEELQDWFASECRDRLPFDVALVADEAANWPLAMRMYVELAIMWGVTKGIEMCETRIRLVEGCE